MNSIPKYDKSTGHGSVSLYDNKNLVGRCGFKIQGNNVCLATEEDTMIIVNSEYRDKNFGQQLTKEALDLILENIKDKKVTICTETTEWNRKAQHILEKYGFKRVEDKEDLNYFPNDTRMIKYIKTVN